MQKLNPLPKTPSGLRSLEDALAEQNVTVLSGDYRELFDLRDRMLKIDDKLLLVYRHEDIRHLSTIPAVSNTPADIYLESAYHGPADNPLSDQERVHICALQRDLFFTSRPPEHKLMKPIFAKAMSPKVAALLRESAAKAAARIVDRVVGTGEINFLQDVADPYAREFWGDVFEMTEDERRAFVGPCSNLLPIATGEQDRDDLVALNDAIPEYLRILTDAIGRVERKGGHPFLNALREQFEAVDQRGQGIPARFEILVAVNIIDGFHAVPAAFSNCLLTLLRNPHQWEALRSDDSTLKAAVYEALRVCSPVPVTTRYLLEDIEYDGLPLSAGTTLVMLWGASTLDPSIQDDAGAFDPARSQKATTLFGGGVQICPGRNIARMMVEEGINALIRPDLTVELTGEPTWRPGLPLTPPIHPAGLPVTITRR